ncbi:MAG: hypothetical protein ACRECA_02690 [Pseudolabrys sp.]
MSNFRELFLSSRNRASAAVIDGLTQAARAFLHRRRRRGRQRVGRAPPVFLGNNHLRRDIGLPPVDRYGRLI